MESPPLLARAVRDGSRHVDQVIVLADSRRFSIVARNLTLPLSRIGILVTDGGLTESSAKMLEDANVRVLIASGESGP